MVKKRENDLSKSRLRSSYVTLVVSLSLVLFLLGVLGFVLINARALADYLRESLSFSVMISDNAREADIRMLQKDLDAKQYIKATEFISKDEAATRMKEDLGDDFVSFLGDNPLPASIDVYLYAGYTSPDSVAKIEKYVLQYPIVKEVYYQPSLLFLITENVRKISLFLLTLSSLLFLIALTLINNTIRLSIYSRRFIIRTMQLVGATRGFIRKPFLVQGAIQGFVASIIAMWLLMGLLYLTEKQFFSMFKSGSTILLFILAGSIMITGLLISVVSTYFSVNRYLNITEDKLYY